MTSQQEFLDAKNSGVLRATGTSHLHFLFLRTVKQSSLDHSQKLLDQNTSMKSSKWCHKCSTVSLKKKFAPTLNTFTAPTATSQNQSSVDLLKLVASVSVSQKNLVALQPVVRANTSAWLLRLKNFHGGDSELVDRSSLVLRLLRVPLFLEEHKSRRNAGSQSSQPPKFWLQLP